MNPTAPLQPHRSSTSCDRHPEENFTGFCPLCLCERLSVLDPNSSPSPSSSSRKPPTSSTAAAALKSIFRSNKQQTTSFLPELRRTKSFSASKNEGFSGVFEPQRKSCDVRVRGTLFNQDSDKKINEASSSSVVQVTVSESNEDEEENREKQEIEVVEEVNVIENKVEEIVEEEKVGVIVEEEELKKMKDHIDLDSSKSKKSSSERDFKESLWSAASVFSKKLQKWRQKQKQKKRRNDVVGNGVEDSGSSAALPVEKPIGRQFRDTQSEIADYGFGRRSCDTDPRFSLDIGRMSFDNDPRYSMDEPRASWDGYLVGRTAIPRMPTMLSVVEDAPVHVLRTDSLIPVEEPLNSNILDASMPGGSAQTREYYSDASSRRRKSLDRSNSIRKTAAAVVAEINELKSGSAGIVNNVNVNVNANAKVTPASTVDYVHVPKMSFLDRELRHSNSLRDDCGSESFDLSFRDNASVIGDRKGSKKSSRRWGKGWSIWGLINRRGGNKDEDEDRYSRANGVECNGDGRGGFNGRMFRSNSSVSWRNAQNLGGSFGSLRRDDVVGVQANGNGKKTKDEFVLERNKSARYSTNNIDNSLLQLYCSRRNGSVKSRSNQAHSIARSVLRLY